MENEKIRITVSTGGKRYLRAEMYSEGDGQMMLSETFDVSAHLPDQDINRMRFDVWKKLERQILLGFYVKGLITAKQYKEECERLEKRFNEVEQILIRQGELDGKRQALPSMHQS